MRKAKELIGKPIVDQASGQHIATVHDLIFGSDAHHVAALLVENGGWFHDARVVCWDAIANIGDVVMVQGDTAIAKASETPELADELKQDVRLSGLPIMSDSGERVGTVGDLFIDDAGVVVGYEIKQGFISDLTGRKFLFAESVQTVGRDAVIANVNELTTLKQAQDQIAQRSVAPADPFVEPGHEDERIV